jgi:2-polyprenyl-6-hydroxyphenyl methylase/3-demethylubiquinone-9 3-methyltransferase
MPASSLPPARVHVGVVPRWDPNDLVSRDCPVCGGRKSQPLCQRPDALEVETCAGCGMMFVRRIPSEQQLVAYYQTYASHKGYSKTRPMSWLELVAVSAQNLYVEALEQTGGLVDRTVLDIGCSTGGFMELVQFKGGRAVGVEIDSPAREEARGHGLVVLEALPETGQYDVTCAFQLLEHLPNPGEMVAAMARLTKPEGRVLFGIPNASEVERLGRDWLGFRVDLEHFNYFTVTSLAALLRRHGLLVEHFWEHRQPHVVRTDIEPKAVSRTWPERLRGVVNRRAIALLRALVPPPERFLEGTFVLSVLARRA